MQANFTQFVEQTKPYVESLRARTLRQIKEVLRVSLETRIDTYDIVSVRRGGHVSDLELHCRLRVPGCYRPEMFNILRALNVSDDDIYLQVGTAGEYWLQIGLDDSSDFRRYAAIRKLLDEAPDIPSQMIEVEAARLNTAIGSER